MAVIHVLTESGTNTAQHIFWNYINAYVYSSALNIIPVNGVYNILPVLTTYSVPAGDVIIVDIDVPSDNSKVINEVSRISKYIDSQPHCYLLGETCFEDTMLQFTYFKEWLYSINYRNNGYKNSYDAILLSEYLNNNSNWRMSNILCNFLISSHITNPNNVSVEKLASLILNHLTYYRQNFSITKGILGKCWVCDCSVKANCPSYVPTNNGFKLKNQTEANKCGLIQNKKDTVEKVTELFNRTIISGKLKAAKKEFLSKGYTVASLL